MAGITLLARGRRGRSRLLALAVFVSIGGIAAPPAATAQVPGVPGTPAVPAIPTPVQDAINTAQDTLVPILIDGAIAAQPVANALGFGLRPACTGTGTAVLLLVLAGGALPANPGFVATPVLIFCGAAFDAGPADTVFDTLDAAAGAQFEDAVRTVTGEVDAGLAPARPQYAAACAVVTLAGSTPRSLPKPLHRVPVVETVC